MRRLPSVPDFLPRTTRCKMFPNHSRLALAAAVMLALLIAAAAAGTGQGEVPREPYVVSGACMNDVLGPACGASVPELGWLNITKMCDGAAPGDDATCDGLRPALPDCDVQGVACFPNVPREAITGQITDICAADPGAPGCGALQAAGAGCLDSAACTAAVTSDACSGGGGICSSLTNMLENFGVDTPVVDRQAPVPADTTTPMIFYRQMDNSFTNLDEPSRVIVFSGAYDPGQEVTVTGLPPGPGTPPPDDPNAPVTDRGEPNVGSTEYLGIFYTHMDNSFQGGGRVGDADVREFVLFNNQLTFVASDAGAGEPDPATDPDPAGGAAGEPIVFRPLFTGGDPSDPTNMPNIFVGGNEGQPIVPYIGGDASAAPAGSFGFTGFQPLDNPDPYISVPGGRDPTVQLMIVVRIQLTAPAGRHPVPAPPVPEPPSLWSAVRQVFSFRGLNASVRREDAIWRGTPPPSGRRAVVRSVANGPAPTSPPATAAAPTPSAIASSAAQGSPLQMFLTNVGSSTGEAFTAHVLNNGDEPMDIDVKGLVVEPLKEEAQRIVQQQLQRIMPQNPVSAQLDAYCLEFLRLPPVADQMFQLAPKGLQEQFAPIRNVLDAAKQLNDLGLLPPDSNPAAYFHSITQWAIWAREEGLDQGGFTDAFVQHTRKQVEATGNQWTGQFDDVVRGAAPARWQNITRILETAAVR